MSGRLCTSGRISAGAERNKDEAKELNMVYRRRKEGEG